MFKIGDYISYRSEGVCVVSDIRKETFNALGTSEEYYILSPLGDMNSKLYVPVSNESLTSMMKPLLSEEELLTLADELRDERMEWISDSRARSSALKLMLARGERRELIVFVNTVYARMTDLESGEKKKYTAGDENTYRRAKKMLLDEFSKTTSLKTDADLMALLTGKAE